MNIGDIPEFGLFAGAGVFFMGGAIGLWLTRTPEVALRTAQVASLKLAKGIAITGIVVSGVSTVALGYEALTAEAPRVADLRGFEALGLEVTAKPLHAESPEQEVIADIADAPLDALQVQLAGGGNNVSWAELQESGGHLHLEVVGLEGVPDPIGWWTVCVGIPLDGLRVAGTSPGWHQYEGTHFHPQTTSTGEALDTDRDAGLYQTYIYEFHLDERPRGPYRLDPLRIGPRVFAAHRIGLGVAKGTDHTGRTEFVRRRSTLRVDCSR